VKRQIQIKNSDKYLFFPIQAKQDKKPVLFYIGDNIISEFKIPINDSCNDSYHYDYLACIPLNYKAGTVITLEGDVTNAFMQAIYIGGDTQLKDYQNNFLDNKKFNHPHIHFTADSGWINDPNGLVYHNGTYHLYFQYNPFDTEWDNMSWGHAVSEDLLHWEQKETPMLPDIDGMIFSGCGLVNEFGMFDLPTETLLYFYSAAGSSNSISQGKDFVQKLAYSLDGGNTLIKKEQPIIPTICKENRDPKVFWHELSKAYIMCLWLEKNEFAILRSVDLEHWDISQRFTLDQGFECPDLFQLPIESSIDNFVNGESKWVFWCADGFYYLGDFDGYEFHPDGSRKEAYATKIPYAAQTISNLGDKVISIPWFKTKTVDFHTGSMGIPREFSLVENDGEILLKQRLVQAIFEKQNLILSANEELKLSGELYMKWERDSAVKIDIEMTDIKESVPSGFKCNVLGVDISYDAPKGILKVEDSEVNIKCNISNFCIIFDKGIIEINANNDIIYAVYEFVFKNDKKEIKISSNNLKELNIFEIL
jgi:sucrose-6-phosphate hydrolase SacC (GH32 family)